MKNLTRFAIIALTATTGSAYAASPSDAGMAVFAGASSFELEDSGTTIKPSGYDFGIRATFGQKAGLFGHVDYTRFKGDDSVSGVKLDLTTDELRATVGYSVPVGANAKVYGEVGYASVKANVDASGGGGSVSDDTTDSGYYVGLGAVTALTQTVSAYGSLGYLSLSPDTGSDETGPDFLGGVSVAMTKQVALFGEIRYASLSQDSTDATLSSYRGGVKFSFQ